METEIEVQEIDMERVQEIQKKKVIIQNKNFLKIIEQAIKELEKINPDDRLKCANGIRLIINSMVASMKGWVNWCNLEVMDSLTLEELQRYFEKLRILAIEWLRCDYEITEAKTSEIESSLENENNNISPKSKSSKEKRKRKSSIYVS